MGVTKWTFLTVGHLLLATLGMAYTVINLEKFIKDIEDPDIK